MNQVIVKRLPGPITRLDVHNLESEQGIKLRIRRSLIMHKNLALVVFALVAALMVAYGFTRKPQYSAESLIYIQPLTPKALTDTTSGIYDSSRYDSYIEQQLQTIVRDDILVEALKRVPPGMWQFPGEPEQAAVARLRAGLKVQRVLSSFEVGITLKGSDPLAVTRVVNEVVAAFLRYGRGDEMAQTDQKLQLLIADRARIVDALTKDREEQAKLSSRLGVADTSNENTGNPYDTQLQELRRQVFAAREAHFAALAQLETVMKGTESTELLNAVSDETASSDPGLATLKASITQRRSALVSQMAGLTKVNPLYRADEQELARLDESLANLSQGLRVKASQQLVGKWKLEVAKTGDVQAKLESQLAQQTAAATGAAPKLQRASDVTTEIARLQARFTETDNAIHSLELQENSSGLAHLSLAAVQPQGPTPGNKRLVFALALPVSLFCGIFAAVLMQKLDRRVYIAEDIEDTLRFPPMAVLPDPSEVDSSVMNDFLLRVVAGIDQAHRVGNAKTFVFTAASPSMDTSDIVMLLADKVSNLGYKVVVSKASAALSSLKDNAIGVPEGQGKRLWGVTDESPLSPVRQTNVLVESLMQTARSVDMLFIDARPILSSADAEFDTRLVDVTILVAGSGLTTRRELASSLALIRRLTSQGVATVLTNLHLRHADRDFLSAVRGAENIR